MVNYYELKYFVTETFYENMLKENYTIGQTSDRCFVEFYRRIKANNIESVIVTSTILARVAIHEKEELKGYIEDYDKMMKILEGINLDDYLNEEENEYLLDDIGYVKQCIENITKKESL